MKNLLSILLAGIFLLGAVAAVAGDDETIVKEEKIVIELATDDFELEATDLSHLAVGDAETIVTESGKTIDLLRTEDGVEVYVDGELLDMEGAHEAHHVTHKIKIVCNDDESECEELKWISEDGEFDITKHIDGDHKYIVIHDENGDIDVEALADGPHEAHGTVHVIRKHGEDVDIELHEEHESEIIIIKKSGDEI